MVKKELKIIALLAFVAVVLLVGPAVEFKARNVHAKQGRATEDRQAGITKTMEVPNPYATLERAKLLRDGVALYQLIGGIGGYDMEKLWRDTLILRNRYNLKKLIICLNSPGGSAFAGLAVADLLVSLHRSGVEVVCHASGLVASAAVPVLVAASRRTCTKNTIFMVHEAMLFKFFAQEELRHLKSQQQMLELERERYINFIVKRSGGKLTRQALDEAMQKGVWFSSEKALKWGLVDEVR